MYLIVKNEMLFPLGQEQGSDFAIITLIQHRIRVVVSSV
jgi:hypothetical protein